MIYIYNSIYIYIWINVMDPLYFLGGLLWIQGRDLILFGDMGFLVFM